MDDDDGYDTPVVVLEEEDERSEPMIALRLNTSNLHHSGSSGSGSGDLTDDILRTTIAFYITDQTSRLFWQTYFLSRAFVPFAEFVQRLFEWQRTVHAAQPSLSDHDCVLLSDFYAQLLGGLTNADLQVVPPEHVTLEQFGQISYFFSLESGLHALLEDFVFLARASWFHGHLTLEEAHSMLRSQPKGSFLIRIGRGAASGSLSVSRVVDPMCVLHSRLYWNAEGGHWALKTSKTAAGSGALSPRMTGHLPLSMMDALAKKRALLDISEPSEDDATPSKPELRAYLRRLKEFDNVLGVPVVSPRPLKEWVAKHSKALDLRVACPGSRFAQIISSRGLRK